MVLRGVAAAKEDMTRQEKLEHSVELPLRLLYLQARANGCLKKSFIAVLPF